jgi:transposase InsO family protein
VEKIAEIREHPPKNLKRVPGPRAILFYLQQDASIQAAAIPLPRSTRTVWKILRRLGYVLEAPERKRKPLELREPLEEVQMDFKDATTVPADPDSKHAHAVDILHFLDAGTSILLSAQPGADYHAETTCEAVIAFLRQHGRPPMLTFDNDPRFVGSSTGRDFPSALRRLLLCLGVVPNVIPPHRPDLNGFIERYHRTYGEECLSRYRPTTFEQVCEVTEAFVEHYNWQRPHQGIACGHRPPRLAFPDLPTLRSVPDVVNADAWLSWIDGEHVVRLVNRRGFVKVDVRPYYVSSKLAGQAVTLRVNATEGCLQVVHPQGNQRSVPLKGLYQRSFSYQNYVELMQREASTRTSLACLTEASHPSEWELFSLLRCWYTGEVTKLALPRF